MNDEIIEISDGESEISANCSGTESNLFFPDKHSDYVVLEWPQPAVKGYRELTIHNADGERLRPEVFFNDCLIDFSITHFSLELLDATRRDRCWNFNTLFMNTLREHQSLRPAERYKQQKWTKSMRIFSKDFLIIPVNHSLHWYTFCVVRPSLVFKSVQNFPLKKDANGNLPCILILDSLARSSTASYLSDIKILREFLVHEWLEKSCTAIQIANREVTFATEYPKWCKVETIIVNSPRQPNGFDCGIYTIKNSEAILNYLESSTITDINDSFATFSSLNNYNVYDVLEHRHFLKVLITSLMQERMKVKECTQQVAIELFHVCTHAVFPEGTRIVHGCTNEGKVLSFTEDFLNVILKTDVLDLVLSFLIDQENIEKTTQEELLIQKILRRYSKVWYDLGFLGSELKIVNNE